jgi:hypothetical protein
MIPTQLMFLCLAVATFAPLLMGLRPDWWITYYYGSLFVLWVVLSVVAVRRAASEQQMVERQSDGTVRPVAETRIPQRAHAEVASHAFVGKRLIIVARDQADLYDRISRVQLRDKAVTVISDRRSAERRRESSAYTPGRRRAERRRNEIAARLRTRGWAEVRLPDG